MPNASDDSTPLSKLQLRRARGANATSSTTPSGQLRVQTHDDAPAIVVPVALKTVAAVRELESRHVRLHAVGAWALVDPQLRNAHSANNLARQYIARWWSWRRGRYLPMHNATHLCHIEHVSGLLGHRIAGENVCVQGRVQRALKPCMEVLGVGDPVNCVYTDTRSFRHQHAAPSKEHACSTQAISARYAGTTATRASRGHAGAAASRAAGGSLLNTLRCDAQLPFSCLLIRSPYQKYAWSWVANERRRGHG